MQWIRNSSYIIIYKGVLMDTNECKANILAGIGVGENVNINLVASVVVENYGFRRF